MNESSSYFYVAREKRQLDWKKLKVTVLNGLGPRFDVIGQKEKKRVIGAGVVTWQKIARNGVYYI